MLISYIVFGTLFLWFFCRDYKRPKNWHALVACTVFSPLVLVWLMLECLKWAWSNLGHWLNEEIYMWTYVSDVLPKEHVVVWTTTNSGVTQKLVRGAVWAALCNDAGLGCHNPYQTGRIPNHGCLWCCRNSAILATE